MEKNPQSNSEQFDGLHKTTDEKGEQLYGKNRYLWLPLMVRAQRTVELRERNRENDSRANETNKVQSMFGHSVS